MFAFSDVTSDSLLLFAADLPRYCSTAAHDRELSRAEPVCPVSHRCSCISPVQPELLQRPGSVQTPQLLPAAAQLSPALQSQLLHADTQTPPLQ